MCPISVMVIHDADRFGISQLHQLAAGLAGEPSPASACC